MIFTIGHSTRSIEAFTALLREAGADMVVDVRTVPRSRTNPQYNRDTLPGSLEPLGIGYRHLASLGGLRGRRKDADTSPNALWQNQSFRNYADYALTQAFRDGLGELRAIAAQRVPAIMCAEAVWWRCHRRIVADYLLVAGEQVRHVLGPGHIEPARLTPGAHPREDGSVLYPAGNAKP